MLDKYEHFKKISKTQGCSFYASEDRTTMQSVLLKRLQQNSTWDQLLTNRNLNYMNKADFAPKMLQIFKKKGYYFIVYQRPTGPPMSEPQLIGKLSLFQFYPLFYDLLNFCMQLRKRNPQAYILPQWVFIHRNTCKIGHFQPFFSNQQDGNKHVFMYNLQKSIIQTNNGKPAIDSDILGFQRKQSLTFNLGAIAYQLLTGTKATTAQTQQQYKAQLAQLQRECYPRLQRITKDQKFSQMITKMLKQDPFECPTLTQIYNMSKKKNKQHQPKPIPNPTVQFDIQKIQLTDKYQPNQLLTRKKFSRPCCKTVQNQQLDISIQKKGNLTMAYVKRQPNKFLRTTHTKNRSFLPQITAFKSPIRYHSKDVMSKPTMLSNYGHFKFKEN